MKILFLTKRYYMSRDLMLDKYGRFYEIPVYLSQKGHTIELVCHNYRRSDQLIVYENENLKISSWNLGINPVYGIVQHYNRLHNIILKSRPDVIITGSDCFQIILGSRLALSHSIPFVTDVYDNFSSYKASKIPGIKTMFYRSLGNADTVTVVSNKLKQLIGQKIKTSKNIHILNNAISDIFLLNHDKQKSRKYFKFKPDEIYIGTAGDLSVDRGIKLLIDTFLDMASQNTILNLVLAGRKEKNLKIPDKHNIYYLGHLNHKEIPNLFSSLDIGIISINDNEFGRYCFPQKYYEMVACRLPLVASKVGEMTQLLQSKPYLLYQPDNREDLKRAILYQLENKVTIKIDVPTWKDQAKKMNIILEKTVADYNG